MKGHMMNAFISGCALIFSSLFLVFIIQQLIFPEAVIALDFNPVGELHSEMAFCFSVAGLSFFSFVWNMKEAWKR